MIRSFQSWQVIRENKWHKELEALIFRFMAGRCQGGWQTA
jgi:hypothetical protein